jgi:predicted RNA-binding Zn ribbon-like protein
MTTPQPLLDPVTPYKYVGGDTAIDFVNTVDWTERGPEKDRFASYDRLLEWVEGARALTPAELAGLRRTAARDGYAAEQAVRDAIALRELLERTFSRLVREKRIDEDVAELNQRWLGRALSEMALIGCESELDAHGGRGEDETAREMAAAHADAGFVLGWPRAAQALESPLWGVAWSAARLLASDDAKRIRRCAGIDCGWFYVDRSRNGLRRWCEMESCGTLMKTRRRAERNARGRAGT